MVSPIIPGQSLTAEPKNAPYENPPQIVDPREAADWHLNLLAEDDREDALLDALRLGMTVETLTIGLARHAVMQGVHSIDVSLIISPIIHEYICWVAGENDVDYDEFDVDADALKSQARAKREAQRVELERARAKAKRAGKAFSGKAAVSVMQDEDVQEKIADALPEAERRQGLMARRELKLTETEADALSEITDEEGTV